MPKRDREPAPPDVHPAKRARDSQRFVHGIDPFQLFCAYHLGLFPDGTVRFANIHDTARALSVGAEDVKEALRTYGLDSEQVVTTTFDVASAQVDIQVSPPGVDLVMLAEMHFDALVSAWGTKRDWESELHDDEEANRRTFGDRGDRERDPS